jgi:DNA-binding MarR family transcriptional regulator
MGEFEVLERLASEGEACVRLQEVAEHVHLSQSALSRVVDRLEKHGLL